MAGAKTAKQAIAERAAQRRGLAGPQAPVSTRTIPRAVVSGAGDAIRQPGSTTRVVSNVSGVGSTGRGMRGTNVIQSRVPEASPRTTATAGLSGGGSSRDRSRNTLGNISMLQNAAHRTAADKQAAIWHMAKSATAASRRDLAEHVDSQIPIEAPAFGDLAKTKDSPSLPTC